MKRLDREPDGEKPMCLSSPTRQTNRQRYERRAVVIEFERILCPIDFSESSNQVPRSRCCPRAVVRRAVDRVAPCPHVDPVQVLGDVGVPVRVVNPVTRDEVVAEIRRVVDLTHVLPAAVVTVQAGDPSAMIIDHALTPGADLIVMGTHGRRGFRRFLLGSVTERVLHEAPCPVLTVSSQTDGGSSDVVTFKRILCPIDFSASALQALGFALDLARQAGGLVTLLHVIEWLPEEQPRTSAHFSVPEFRRHMVDEAEQQLRALVTEESQVWCDIDPVIVFGRAHREILRAAQAKSVELIVIGAQGRGGLDLALFGSTTQQVVRGATCPVLTVRGVPHT